MLAVGLMSGTSLDGIDAALVDITGCGRQTKVRVLEFTTSPIPNDIREELNQVLNPCTGSVNLICSLNFKLGKLFAEAATDVCKKHGTDVSRLDFIASHGQTIWHTPRPSGSECRSTLQIGEPAVIAFETGVTVVSGFRTMDMAAGGNGAPLVPFSEYVLFGSNEESIALLNIGGIANISVLPAGCRLEDIYAFDTGPGNMVTDAAVRALFNQKCDFGGKIAAKGQVSQSLLKELASHSYLALGIPKTTGREAFGEAFTNKILEDWGNILPPEDIVATITRFTAFCIGDAFRKHIFPRTNVHKLVASGGGVHNDSLMRFLKEELPDIDICRQEDLGFSSDAKEAVAFAILGNETLHHNPSNVPGATGASKAVILGNITYPPCNPVNV